MHHMDYLAYAAKEPMTVLRRKFNSGESIVKTASDSLTAEDAIMDVSYLRFIFENAYSGYPYYDESLFSEAFDAILKKLHSIERISANALIDLICTKLSFICDGHLALTTQDYGKGFYQKRQIYVSDMLLIKKEDRYYDINSGKQISFDEPVCALPTIAKDADNVYLLGVRSTKPKENISLKIDDVPTVLPVHKIASKAPEKETPIEEHYGKEVAIITCSSFVGDSEEVLDQLYEAGKKCRKYQHVIWDLSNNSGGNSELPKRFLLGLTGKFGDTVKYLALKSSLVHAKECGKIQNIPHHFESSSNADAANENLFDGELHVIINDRVASSAEIAIAWAASLPRVTFYGCNSLGIGQFGDLCIYYLPHSQITFWCPQKVFDTGISETFGFEPKYYIDSENALDAVLRKLRISSEA